MSASWFFRHQLSVPPFAACQRSAPVCSYCRGDGAAFGAVCPACDGDGTEPAALMTREEDDERA